MKSIQRRFNNLQKKRPELSSLMNFTGAVREGDFSSSVIHRWFNRLVEKDDYDPKDKRAILAYVKSFSKSLRTTGNEGYLALRRSPSTNGIVRHAFRLEFVSDKGTALTT